MEQNRMSRNYRTLECDKNSISNYRGKDETTGWVFSKRENWFHTAHYSKINYKWIQSYFFLYFKSMCFT